MSNASVVALRETISKFWPHGKSIGDPKYARRDLGGHGAVNPGESKHIATFPLREERIRERWTLDRTINEHKFVLHFECHSHGLDPTVIICAIKHWRNENQRWILIWMNVVRIWVILWRYRRRGWWCWTRRRGWWCWSRRGSHESPVKREEEKVGYGAHGGRYTRNRKGIVQHAHTREKSDMRKRINWYHVRGIVKWLLNFIDEWNRVYIHLHTKAVNYQTNSWYKT